MIVAMTPDMIIGKDGHLPWHLKSDLIRFKTITSGHHVVMGRVNYEDIGRPLPNRTNLILTRDPDFTADGCTTVASIEEAIRIAENAGETELFVIGGASAYRAAMPYADKLYLTIVCAKVEGTVKFPAECWTKEWIQVGTDVNALRFSWPFLDSDSYDDYDTLYCTFVKKRYLELTMGTMSVLDPYQPTRQDMYAMTMMNME